MMEQEHHWCIKIGCTHGTLNGSLQLGSYYLNEYNRGYEQGRKDAETDRLDAKSMCNCKRQNRRGNLSSGNKRGTGEDE